MKRAQPKRCAPARCFARRSMSISFYSFAWPGNWWNIRDVSNMARFAGLRVRLASFAAQEFVELGRGLAQRTGVELDPRFERTRRQTLDLVDQALQRCPYVARRLGRLG